MDVQGVNYSDGMGRNIAFLARPQRYLEGIDNSPEEKKPNLFFLLEITAAFISQAWERLPCDGDDRCFP